MKNTEQTKEILLNSEMDFAEYGKLRREGIDMYSAIERIQEVSQ